MTASEHLLAILGSINGDAYVISAGNHIDGAGSTHLVIDADGDTLGRGSTADAAVADAIRHELALCSEHLDHFRRTIRAYRKARLDLDDLV